MRFRRNRNRVPLEDGRTLIKFKIDKERLAYIVGKKYGGKLNDPENYVVFVHKNNHKRERGHRFPQQVFQFYAEQYRTTNGISGIPLREHQLAICHYMRDCTLEDIEAMKLHCILSQGEKES